MSVSAFNSGSGLLAGLNPEQVNEIRNNEVVQPGKRIFVVHRHLSSVLHYDLRLEVDGVLKSWALPSGPSMNAEDRRFAIAIDDKPLDFATSRGLYKQGNIDGIVESWDRGVFVPHSLYAAENDRDLLDKIRNGRISFSLKGRKLRGVFTLMRLSDPRHWVLLKGNDRFSVTTPYSAEALVDPRSRINQMLAKK